MTKPKVFVSYSHRDRAWKDRLVGHLQVLEREGALDLWDDDRIPVGADWLAEIQGAIKNAQVVVLLVSVDFLNSRFIREKEVPEFLARRKNQGLHVFPVIVDECLWEEVNEISSIQSRPLDGRTLASFSGSGRNRELVAIAREILRLVATNPASSVSKPIETLRPLHQLPAPPADFVGRETELAELGAVIKEVGITVCGIQGMGGMGKSVLALKLAHECREAFIDGQIYLDLRGASAKPVTSDEAMAHVIRTFHPEAKLPEGEQLAAYYREVLHGKRVLLLMDKASGKEQVESLVPPHGCSLVFTSRSQFVLPGIHRRILHELPEKEACILVLKIADRVGDQASKIARLCGYLPFALRIAASTVAERSDLKVVEIVRRLEKEEKRAELGEAALGLSYALLPEVLQARFRTLAVFLADFDAAAAAAVWGLEVGNETADESLGELVRRSLLDGAAGRYKLHNLARAFAGAQLAEPEKNDAHARHAEHFLWVLFAASTLYEQGNENILRGLAFFDRERTHILAGQAWVAERVETSEESARIANQFPDVGIRILRLRLSPREQIRWFEAGLAGARKLNDRSMEGNHLGNLGLAYHDLGEIRRAIESHEAALVISREIGDKAAEGHDLCGLGLAYRELGDNRRAIDFHEQHLAIAHELGDRKGEGNALGNLGNAYAALGETHRAIDFHEQHLGIARELGDRKGEGNALGDLGNAYAAIGETERSIEYHEQRLGITRELGDRRGEAGSLSNLGNAYLARGETQLAIEHYEQYIAFTREIGNRLDEAKISWNLGMAYEKRGDLVRAINCMQTCVDLLRQLGGWDVEKHEAHVEALRVLATTSAPAPAKVPGPFSNPEFDPTA